MANHNDNTGSYEKATNSINAPQYSSPVRMDSAVVHLPLRYTGGNLGLGECGELWIDFRDDAGNTGITHSLEWCLKNIDWFKEGRAQKLLLADAAMHYGLTPHALMGQSV